MKLPLIQSDYCASGTHCGDCRARHAGVPVRRYIETTFAVGENWPDCPFGKPFTEDEQPKMKGLGDAIARATKAMGIPKCGGCAKRQAMLNRLVPFDRQ